VTPHSSSLRVLAVIPARGGSKGLPDKNIRPLAGKPLIAWTIAAAQAAGCLDRVVVSTDNEAIAAVARKFGAETPFLRPPEWARDETPTTDAVGHAVRWLDEHQGYRPDAVMILQPTCPLRTADDIRQALGIYVRQQARSVVAVCEAKQHPLWMKQVAADGRLTAYLPDWEHATQRQLLPKVYALNGALYLVQRDVLLEQNTVYPPDTFAYVMPKERSVDIDTPWDLHVAELLLTHPLSA
jgi:CMP-N,N'-diacetyllegionaminic acid synthase